MPVQSEWGANRSQSTGTHNRITLETPISLHHMSLNSMRSGRTSIKYWEKLETELRKEGIQTRNPQRWEVTVLPPCCLFSSRLLLFLLFPVAGKYSTSAWVKALPPPPPTWRNKVWLKTFSQFFTRSFPVKILSTHTDVNSYTLTHSISITTNHFQ